MKHEKIDWGKVNERIVGTISTEEALKDAEPYFSEDFLNGYEQGRISKQKEINEKIDKIISYLKQCNDIISYSIFEDLEILKDN